MNNQSSHNGDANNSLEKTQKKYTRSDASVIYPLEEKYLSPLAYKVPKWLEAYHILLLTIVWSFLIIVFSYLSKFNIHWLWGTSICILLHIVSDHLDGLVGRIRKTGLVKWGYYMDHFLDYIFMSAVLVGYSFFVTEEYKYLIFFVHIVFTGFLINSFLSFSSTGKFKVTYMRIGPTEIRLLFVCINILFITFGATYMGWLVPVLLIGSAIGLLSVVYEVQKEIWLLDLGSDGLPNWPASQIKYMINILTFKERIPLPPAQFRIPLTSITVSFSFIFIIFLSLGCYFYLTNPFNNTNIVTPLYEVISTNSGLDIEQKQSLRVINNPIVKALAWAKAGFHIISNVYAGSAKSKFSDSESIIRDIYTQRFDPSRPYITSGDHFSVLYPRNLGTFYIPTLDPRVKSSDDIWKNRQISMLKSVAFALEVFSQNGEPCTTIVPLGYEYYTCIPVYAYPSDSMYSLLFTLESMGSSKELERIYPYTNDSILQLSTQNASNTLLKKYKKSLQKLLENYIGTVYDTKTGLVKKDIHISGMKDITQRSSAFYDNVIYWRTLELADMLGLKKTSQGELSSLKEKILKTYWYEEGGYFLEDRSSESLSQHFYSSDWLVVLFTGFLSPSNIQERMYYEKSFAYIQKSGLNKPFGLPYQKEDRGSRQFPIVRMFLQEYGGTAIWSFWGTEYIKALVLTGNASSNQSYIFEAQRQLDAYKKNIETYRGFPELYNRKGEMLSTPFYKSIRQTGWVINYDQAHSILSD